ncbi:nociceptin receptor-like [Acanthaster planci]|uniref:Nociceptin receptor-like n=1 Tax=Acanthaster planci TaxID=133434 RepID=A0A8B7YQ67_ACAPL|nr:nociceptin receptor-like [Acanthaster planci]
MSSANNLTAEYPPYRDVGFAVLMTLGVTGILGNTLVCLTICQVRFMHTTTNYLIAHLALADLLVCATFLAFQERFIHDNLEDPLLCLLFKNGALAWLMASVSTASMVLVTAERYVAIVYPLHYPCYLSSRRLKLAIAGIWLLSAPLALIQIFIQETIDSVGCLQNLTIPKGTLTALYALQVALFIIPMLSLFYCYGRIMINLHRSARRHHQANNAGHAEDLNRAQRKVAIVLLMTAAIYIAVWLTMTLLYLFILFHTMPGSGMTDIVKQLYQPILFVFNSMVNPIIYAFKYKEFQRGVREALLPRCLIRQHKVDTRGNDIAMG